MRFVLALSIFAFSAIGFAAEQTPTLESSRFDWRSLANRVDASYALLALGPTLEHMDGNLDGRGGYLSLRNYLNFDYELAPNLKAEVGGEFRQYFRPVDPKKPGRSNFESRDPYLGLSRRDLFQRGNFSLSARGKAFLPVTAYNKTKRGSTFDTGRGQLQLGIGPQWRFRDGSVTVSCATEASINFAAGENPRRENYSVKMKPAAAYRFSPQWSSKLEYSTGDLRHNKLGKWSKFNDKDLGHKVTVYGNYSPIRELLVSPALAWGRDTWRLKKAEVSLYASYAFL